MKKRPQTLSQSWPGLRRILAHFAPALRRQLPLVAASLLALTAEVGLRALEPWPLKFIFDRVFSSKHHHAAGLVNLLPLNGLAPATLITLAALAIVVITALRALAAYGNTVGFARISNRVLTEARGELYQHLQRLSLSFHARARSGDLTLRLMSDVNMLKDVVVTALLPLLVNLGVLVVMVGAMFWLHWRLALLALSVLPLLGLWTIRLGRRVRQTAREQRKRDAAMAATAVETIGAIKVVQALCLEAIFAQGFLRRNQESRRADVKAARLMAALERTVGFLTAASTALVLWYGARLVLRGELTPGDLLVFMAYLRSAFRPVQDFAKHAGRLAKAAVAGERVLDVLERTPEVRDLPGAVPAPPFRGAVRFEDVCFAYEPGQPVLDHIDFEVQAGQQIALAGPSGIGKSTLVGLLLRLYDPEQGQVLIDGHDIRGFTLASLRPQISVVLQDTLLFAASARDNIAYGAPDSTPEAVEAAARLANAHDFIQALPQGYDTVLGERGITLSGGQRQRIAIARAAIRKTPLLVLDEPATGLDGDNERAVLKALRRLARGRTTFVITHDLQVAARADRIFYLDRGRVLESGTHAELMAAGGSYATLYRQQTVRSAWPPGGDGVLPPTDEPAFHPGDSPRPGAMGWGVERESQP
jgi:ATP-binding cassette subfamily B protein